MSENKVNAPAAEELVTTDKFHWSDLWKKEDWLAVWIGFIVIIIGVVGVLTGTYDFGAAKFGTWGNGESLVGQLTAGFLGKLLLTVLVLGILFTVGNALRGVSIKKYIPTFLGYCSGTSGIKYGRGAELVKTGCTDRILY